MADVLIRGMEMPATCFNCKLKVGFSACGLVTDHKDGGFFYRVYEGNYRPDWCPLVPLPEGYGRLIDADAVVKTICNSCDGACDVVQCDCLNCKADCRCDIVKEISDAPTIIEADIEWKMKNCCCFSNTDPAEGGTDDA